MARIRTIKPEFFTSEDVVCLPPLARLLYIALWCEADREGRLVWKPTTFKLRYFPGDICDIGTLCDSLVARGLVVVYVVENVEYAYIPTFHSHQHINPRETVSQLPEPSQTGRKSGSRAARVGTRPARVGTCANLEMTRREEGKGREGKGKERNIVVNSTKVGDENSQISDASITGRRRLTRSVSSASQRGDRRGMARAAEFLNGGAPGGAVEVDASVELERQKARLRGEA